MVARPHRNSLSQAAWYPGFNKIPVASGTGLEGALKATYFAWTHSTSLSPQSLTCSLRFAF